MSRYSIPEGYAYFPSTSGDLVLVPLAAAEHEQKRLRQDRLNMLKQRVEEEKMRNQSAEAAPPDGSADVAWPELAGITRVVGSRVPAAPTELHRVIPRWSQVISDEDELTRTADSDRRTQRKALQDRLRKLGPDRMLARPENWRGAIAELKTDMPNFAGPIGLVERCLALAEVSATPVRIPPVLLLGPPGLGKTLFSQRIASMLETSYGALAFDNPSYGSSLRGLDKSWGNSESGLLFNLVCLGDYANPVVLLDEIDKSVPGDSRGVSPLTQLHGVLEPQTARCIQDLSTEIEFDASLVTYIATANSLDGIGLSILSRFEIFNIGPPTPDEAVHIAESIGASVLARLGLSQRIFIEHRAYYVLARLSPRLIGRTVEKLLGDAVLQKVSKVTADSVWTAVGLDEQPPTNLH